MNNATRPVRITAVYRAPCYSPNSEANDRAVLDAVCRRLERRFSIASVAESGALPLPPAEAYVSMGRSAPVLAALKEAAGRGAVVVNSAESVALASRRSLLRRRLRDCGLPLSPDEGPCGYWVKRADGTAQTPADVQYAPDRAAAAAVAAAMRAQGAADVVTEAHVEGDVVKFYGVAATGFFRLYYPGDDGQSKFGDEQRNGPARHYAFDGAAFRHTIQTAAAETGLEVYGGDAIIRPDGTFVLIDLNDWPSFSRCREEAADAIAACICRKIQKE